MLEPLRPARRGTRQYLESQRAGVPDALRPPASAGVQSAVNARAGNWVAPGTAGAGAFSVPSTPPVSTAPTGVSAPAAPAADATPLQLMMLGLSQAGTSQFGRNNFGGPQVPADPALEPLGALGALGSRAGATTTRNSNVTTPTGIPAGVGVTALEPTAAVPAQLAPTGTARQTSFDVTNTNVQTPPGGAGINFGFGVDGAETAAQYLARMNQQDAAEQARVAAVRAEAQRGLERSELMRQASSRSGRSAIPRQIARQRLAELGALDLAQLQADTENTRTAAGLTQAQIAAGADVTAAQAAAGARALAANADVTAAQIAGESRLGAAQLAADARVTSATTSAAAQRDAATIAQQGSAGTQANQRAQASRQLAENQYIAQLQAYVDDPQLPLEQRQQAATALQATLSGGRTPAPELITDQLGNPIGIVTQYGVQALSPDQQLQLQQARGR